MQEILFTNPIYSRISRALHLCVDISRATGIELVIVHGFATALKTIANIYEDNCELSPYSQEFLNSLDFSDFDFSTLDSNSAEGGSKLLIILDYLKKYTKDTYPDFASRPEIDHIINYSCNDVSFITDSIRIFDRYNNFNIDIFGGMIRINQMLSEKPISFHPEKWNDLGMIEKVNIEGIGKFSVVKPEISLLQKFTMGRQKDFASIYNCLPFLKYDQAEWEKSLSVLIPEHKDIVTKFIDLTEAARKSNPTFELMKEETVNSPSFALAHSVHR